jgi:hypothetical protein
MNKDVKGPVIMSNRRVADYAFLHLCNTAEEVGEIKDDIQELIMHPSRNLKSEQNEQRLEHCRKLAREMLEYVSQGLRDLRELENANSVKK